MNEGKENQNNGYLRTLFNDLILISQKYRRKSYGAADFYNLSQADRLKYFNKEIIPIVKKHNYPDKNKKSYMDMTDEIIIMWKAVSEGNEMPMAITRAEVTDFNNRWKSKLKAYGVTEFALSTHFNADRLNHKRNVPPLTIKELDFVLEKFLQKVGPQFKKDVENVKNHTAKRRGVNKNQIPENELEFAITSNSTHVKFVFVLKQDWHKKGTAIVLPMTIIRKKNFKVIKGERVIVERLCK